MLRLWGGAQARVTNADFSQALAGRQSCTILPQPHHASAAASQSSHGQRRAGAGLRCVLQSPPASVAGKQLTPHYTDFSLKQRSTSEVNQIMLAKLMSVIIVHSKYFCTMFLKLQMFYCSSNISWAHEVSHLNVKARLTKEEQVLMFKAVLAFLRVIISPPKS